MPLTVGLTAESDTGINSADGITKIKTPKVTGVAMPGAIVTLYANSTMTEGRSETIVGMTTVANSGNWDITSQELSDGNYDLSVEIRTLSGQVIKRNVKSVVIDSVAPDVSVSGILEGIDWKSTDQLNALIADRGVGLSNVTYQLDGQSPIGWTGTNGTWTKSAGDLLNWNDTNQQGVHTLTLKALDKAGNEQQQTIGFSVAKPLIWLDTDVWIDDSTLSNPIQPNGLTALPLAGSGGSGGGMAQYGWGTDGRWGYSYGGSWYSSGISDPQSLIGTPWLPSGGNLNSELMNYRIRLQTILKTAIAVIPNTSAENQTKRAALKNRMSLLIEAGAYLNGDSEDDIDYGYEGGGFNTNHYWQDKFFQGVLEKANNRSINPVNAGIALAKDLMMGSDSVRLLTFQTLVETTIGAAHLATNDWSPSYTDEIQQSARELAKTYGLLKPQGTILTGRFAWLDKLWDLTETPSTSGTAIRQILFGNNSYGAGGIVGEVVAGMKELAYDHNYDGDAGMFQLLQMSDRLLKSASTIGGWRSDLETTEFTQALLNFGYEVVKVHPTVDSSNLTEVSTWVETLLEGGDVRMAAAGLSDFLSGVVVRGEKVKTLEYADRLLQASTLIDDYSIRDQFRNAELCSSLVSWGAAYRKESMQIDKQGLFDSPFTELASTNDLNTTAIKLKDWYLFGQGDRIEIPFSEVSIKNGRPTFYVDLFGLWEGKGSGEFDVSPGSSKYDVYADVSEGSAFDTILERWTGALQIRRTDERNQAYSAISSIRKIWIFSKSENEISDIDRQRVVDKGYIPIYLGDRAYATTSITSNRFNNKFPSEWIDKLQMARDLAIEAAPSRFTGEVRQIWNSVIEQPLLTGAGLLGMGAVHVFAPPVAIVIDAAMMAFFGAKSVIHLGSFFIQAVNARNQAELKSASNELLDFVGSAINAAMSGASIFAANKVSKGAAFTEVGNWFRGSVTLGGEFIKSVTWKNIFSLRSSADAGKTFFLEPALKSMQRDDVRKFLTYGKDSAISFLSESFSQVAVNPLSNLRNFGERWNSFGQIIEKLDSLPEIATVIKQFPTALPAILEYGSGSLDILKKRLELGESLTTWIRSISESPEIGKGILTVAGREYVDTFANANDLISYGRVLALTSDIQNIANKLGIPAKILEAVKKHHFLNKHDIQTGANLTRKNVFFTPTEENAAWWLNASAGKLTDPREIERFKRFLVHEYVESELMKRGLPFVSDNPQYWNAGRLPSATYFGAHDIAPYADISSTKTPFFIWEKYLGQQPGVLNELKSGDDLIQNIDNIVKASVQLFVK